MAPSPNGTDEQHTTTPETVMGQYHHLIRELHERDEDDIDPFRALFTPRSRGEVLHALLGVKEPLTAAEFCDRHNISRSTFGDHIDVLVAAGVVEEAGRRANAQTYRRNSAHPVTQLLIMAETAQSTGFTPLLLDEEFIGTPGENVDPETGEEVKN